MQHAHSGIDSNNARNAGIDCHSIRQVGSGTARKDERENERASERGTMHPNSVGLYVELNGVLPSYRGMIMNARKRPNPS